MAIVAGISVPLFLLRAIFVFFVKSIDVVDIM